MVLYDSYAVSSLEVPYAYLYLLLPQSRLSKFRNFKLIRKTEFGRFCLMFNFHNFLFYGFKMLKNILIFLQLLLSIQRKYSYCDSITKQNQWDVDCRIS